MLHPKAQISGHAKAAAFAALSAIAFNVAPALAADDGSDRLSGTVGVGIAAVPDYEGSDDYRVLPLPIFDLRYKSFFANFENGLGVYLLEQDRFQAGVSAAFVPGRRAKDSPEGVGKVEDTVGARAFASYQPISGLSLTATVTRALGGTDGTLVDLSASYMMTPSKKLMLIPSVSLSWADNKHNSAYFGIDQAQSARSGLPVFDADAGLKGASMALVGIYALNESWHLNATAVVTRSLGDAGDSPLNEQKWQPAAIVGVGYRF